MTPRYSSLARIGSFLRPVGMLHIALTVATLGLTLFGAWAWIPAEPPTTGCSLTRNAAWIGVEWVSEPVVLDAVAGLALDTATHRLTTLFPYVTYLKADGIFNSSFDYAAEFVAAYKAIDPQTDLLAWIGIPLATDRPLSGVLLTSARWPGARTRSRR